MNRVGVGEPRGWVPEGPSLGMEGWMGRVGLKNTAGCWGAHGWVCDRKDWKGVLKCFPRAEVIERVLMRMYVKAQKSSCLVVRKGPCTQRSLSILRYYQFHRMDKETEAPRAT